MLTLSRFAPKGGSFRRRANAASAVAVSLLVMAFLGLGTGAVPPLGVVLDPGTGIWDPAADALPVGSRTIDLPGMHAPATVSFDTGGVPTVRASTDEDLFLAQGYVQAYFRLGQLDLERRTAEGSLAELNGPGGVASDTFELQTGLLRTAQATLRATPPDSPDGQALDAFSRGVNARLKELRATGSWPAVFTLTGVYPRDWTPVDSLAVQGLLSQVLSFTTQPLDYRVLNGSLGPERTKAFFPVLPADAQRPYDVGPYQDLGVDPLPADGNVNAAGSAGGPAPAAADPADDGRTASPAALGAADSLLARLQQLPSTQIHTYPDSNSWVANGPSVAGGASLLAGDPHLDLTLPSFWFQIALSAPTTTASGASLVGLPGVVVGRNAQISWSMTSEQNQSNLFYDERTSPDRPHQYYWQGAWQQMQQVHYTIPVRAGAAVPLDVDLTVHGPVVSTEDGRTTSVTWMGNYVSRSLKAIIAVDKAQNYQQFRDALQDWHAPTLNFSYADGQGDIGVVSAGYFPVVKAGEPWLPLPGTGEDDLAGVIPYAATPQAHNPPGHVLATTNQRPVSGDYPYYIGTSLYFDNGYRADQVYESLEGRTGLTAADFGTLQGDVTDHLSTLIVPQLEAALRGAPLDDDQRGALARLTGWDHRMTESSAAASIWWTFWNDYLSEVFQPWWDDAKVPVGSHPNLKVSAGLPSLDEDLEAWTLGDPGNAAFSPPGRTGTASSAMRTAFERAVGDLRTKLGKDQTGWNWGRLHTREIPAISGAGGLGHGPDPAPGDRWTVNAAEGGMNSSFGPSWRMVVGWTGPGSASASAVYPGGQSENPASPWYRNFVEDWWNDKLRPMPWADDQAKAGALWTLRAKG
ncbi:penicillin acylase family protein [Kitasatospora sp. NPDC127059]|uniref:penicillin acylase family protein n=1 Tax=unclassified Kitasatospora TaxID=2633591 RepID=UPI00365D5C8B